MERVVITGMGAVTPIGNTVNEYWEGLQTGKNGVAPITHFDASGYKASVAAEVKNFDPSAVIEKREVRHMDLYCQFAMVAAEEAIKQSGLTEGNFRPVSCRHADGFRYRRLMTAGTGAGQDD